MSSVENGVSLRHPHEPEVTPVYNHEGRCLVCGCEWRDQQIAMLRDVLDLVVAWLGVPDWEGPQLPEDLARRIAFVFDRTAPSPPTDSPQMDDSSERDIGALGGERQ